MHRPFALVKRWISAATFCVLALPMMPASAAPLQPPLQALRNPIFTLVSAQRLDQPIHDQRLKLRVSEVIRGPELATPEIDLLVLPSDDQRLPPSKQLLIYYSDVERVNFKPRTSVRRPDRRQLVHIDGANPAVFADTPQMRKLLADDHRVLESQPGFRSLVIDGLQSADPAMVDFWSAELSIRPGTFPQLLDAEIEIVKGAIANADLFPATRSRLLLSAFDRSPAFGKHWYVESAKSVLTDTALPTLADQPGTDTLIYTALLIAQQHPTTIPPMASRKWLQAAPAIAENAALALRAHSPEVERHAVVDAIADVQTPESTKGMLRDYLRRLDRQRASL